MSDIYIQPPQKRTIFFDDYVEKYFLPLPYVVIGILDVVAEVNNVTRRQKYSKVLHKYLHVAFAKEYPQEDTKLFYVPFRNFLTDFQVCLGRYAFDLDQEVINEFWFSPFEYGHVIPFRAPPSISIEIEDMSQVNYDKWAKLSLDQALNLDWQDTYRKFGQFRQYFSENRDINMLL